MVDSTTSAAPTPDTGNPNELQSNDESTHPIAEGEATPKRRTRAVKLVEAIPAPAETTNTEPQSDLVVPELAGDGKVPDSTAETEQAQGTEAIQAHPKRYLPRRKLTPKERAALRREARQKLRTLAAETRGFKAELEFTLTTKVATAIYKNTYADVVERTNALVGGAIGGLGIDKGLTFLEPLHKAFDVADEQIAKLFEPIQSDIAAAQSRSRKITMVDASTPMLKSPVTVNNIWSKRYYDLLAQIDTCVSRTYLLQFDGLRDDLDVQQLEERLRKIPYALAKSVAGLQIKLYKERNAEQRAAYEADHALIEEPTTDGGVTVTGNAEANETVAGSTQSSTELAQAA